MERYKTLFTKLPAIIGMIHVPPLLGTPMYSPGDYINVIEKVKKEAEIYSTTGVDAVLIENMHDIPYLNRNIGPEITASMTAVAVAVKSIVSNLPCGIQILAGCNKEALAVARATNLDFIRAECFVFGHISDEGMMNADAGELLRYRKNIDADNILVFTDIKKKHCSHSITGDVDLSEVCKAAEFFLSDGVIITGTSTGSPACHTDLFNAKNSSSLPVLVGSGVTQNNVSQFLHADGFIIGSYFKECGCWRNQLSKERITNFVNIVKKLRSE